MKSQSLSLRSRAPTRIDLAGGTVDLWPIYLMLDQAATVNLGIDLFAEARLHWAEQGTFEGVRLESLDQNQHLQVEWSQIHLIDLPPALALHGKLLRHFLKTDSDHRLSRGMLTLSTQAKSPAGAGLGGSSTLSVAMIGALAHWAKGSLNVPIEGEKYVEITRDVETTVIQVPAGIQDYYGAMFGNLQAWHWQAGAHRRELFGEAAFDGIEKRVSLFYSGQSRNSGINNWVLFKSFIDRDPEVRRKFQEIVESTLDLEKALHAKNWSSVGEAIAREWSARKTLAQGITTPGIDRALSVAEKEFGGVGKICGAGGGGCFFVYLPDADPERKKRLAQQIQQACGNDVRPLDFKAVPHGVQVDHFAN
jgi:D-glycero-alpha-D-manno-heptose-7-phosphate kinase